MKILFYLFTLSLFLNASEFDFKLKAINITKNVYMVEGKKEYFSVKNAGDISNSYFIINKKEVLVIDTGTSYLYGKQLKKLIKKITNKKIRFIINTHHHPDHFLGNQAFRDAKIYSSSYTQEYINKNADEYIVNLTFIILKAMKDTEVMAPTYLLKNKYFDYDGHKIRVLYFKGHTKSDIALYDEKTKILFASDLVFNNRAAATPNANIKQWIQTLKELKKIPYKYLASGHGKISRSKEPINQTISYLNYIDTVLKDSVKKGLNVFEILELEKPKEFQGIFMLEEEFERSIINLLPLNEDKIEE